MQKLNNQTGRKWTFFGFNSQFDYCLDIKKQDNTEKGNWGETPEIKGSLE